jgi:hypothetical protein
VTHIDPPYELAKEVLTPDCTQVFLMQRSSTLILGPESGFRSEQKYYEVLADTLDSGVEVRHIVHLKGIETHFRVGGTRQFPEVQAALNRLRRQGEIVGWKDSDGRFTPFKKLKKSEEDHKQKEDRQLRTIMVKASEGRIQGAFASDLGHLPLCFHLKGPALSDLFRRCWAFWGECQALTWEDLLRALRGRTSEEWNPPPEC